jgi:hypothetical protein
MNSAEYLLPPLPGCGDLKPTTNDVTQSTEISTCLERLTQCDPYCEGQRPFSRTQIFTKEIPTATYKSYDAYHSQIRKLDWLKAHCAFTASPEVTPHTTWLIETLHAIIARWEEVLPYIAQPYTFPPNNPSAFT